MEDDERREATIASSTCLNPKFTATSDGAKPRLPKFQVAGGDGTAGWILGVISDLNLSQHLLADEWDMNKWAWEGTMKVVSKGEECIIRLEDKATDGEPHPVEPVIDRSRYFVLRVEENIGGRLRHAFIGIGFRERPQAYDFQTALHDHMKYISNPLLPHCAKRLDYSLKDGQTLVLQLKNLKIVRSLDTMVDVRTRHEYASKEQLADFISSLYGHVASLLRHMVGSVVVEHAYQLGNATQKQALLMELYSTELQLFKDLVSLKERR
ncbi:hypothetical protein L2E82_49816 [Cichorium intybus]|uniref:Uncharacterized protein n=1 Tax=Cichorium intybus TaxID=13427 RepID=A0ACB8Z0Y2_CICIN|nr:hypothetical protein L2E82_49816 [Cichorium intybus]